MPAVTCTWIADNAQNSSTDAAWDTGLAPVAGDNLVFNSTHTGTCTINQAITFGTITLGASCGTVIQGAVSFGVSTFSMAGGTFTGAGDATKTITFSGSFTVTAGTVTNYKIVAIFAGTGSITGANFLYIGISGTYSLESSAACYGTGAGLDISGSLNNKAELAYKGTANPTISGTVTQTGGAYLHFYLTYGNYNIGFTSTIDCDTTIDTGSSAAASGTATLTHDLIMTKSLTVKSSHASNTVTLNHAGYSLSASSITASTRGVITDSVGGGTITGPITVNGTGAVLTQGSTIPLRIFGALTLTAGTVTQVGPIWIGGAITVTGGVFTGDGINPIYHTGPLAVTSITPTAAFFRNCHTINAYGAISQGTLAYPSEYMDDVTIKAGTVTANTQFHCKNLTIASGATFVQSANVPIIVCGQTSNAGTYTQNTPALIVSGAEYSIVNPPANFPVNCSNKVGISG